MNIPGRNSTGHGGNIHAVLRDAGREYGEILDFSANINPLGAPEWFRSLMSKELEKVAHYPDPDYSDLTCAVAAAYEVRPEQVLPGNGSTELLYLLTKSLPCIRAVIPVPSYIDYERAARLAGLEVVLRSLPEEDDFRFDCKGLASQLQQKDLVIFASPNNPTGSVVQASEIMALAGDFPDCFFLVDEAFLDFVEEGKSVGGRADNIITLNSMTKFYGVPGLRLGFALMSGTIAERAKRQMPPWTLNTLAQAFGIAALADLAYRQKTLESVGQLRADLTSRLRAFGELKVYPSRANYLLIRLQGEIDAPTLAHKMLDRGILIRCCDNYAGFSTEDRRKYFRIAVRTAQENDLLIAALEQTLRRG